MTLTLAGPFPLSITSQALLQSHHKGGSYRDTTSMGGASTIPKACSPITNPRWPLRRFYKIIELECLVEESA